MKNHFQIFSLATLFKIDLDELEKKYLQFQKQFHPDNSSTADIEKSINVNDAYNILKNPLKRAAHILQLNGIDIENDAIAPKVDASTLHEILELREKISESSEQEIEGFKKDLIKKVKSLLDEVAASIDNKDFNTSSQILIKAKYFDKTLQDLKRKK